MNKRLYHRLPALALAVCLTAALSLPPARAADPEEDVLVISTVEELRQLAKDCALDTWSQGKTVALAADLELEAEEFSPIPTFGGAFLGQGHTISGLRLTASGSTQGLFRYIQPTGLVRDLSVRGIVAPEGTRSAVGGIAGSNAGTLENCSFQGTVRGESLVGGIAGRNDPSGQIIGCSAGGTVSGESASGGIAGRNLGLLLKCENSAGVNLTHTETPVDLLGTDAGAALEERAAADDETYHLLSSCSDTGGIAGDSSGVIQSCINRGDVGYPHVGYNTGGIAGRQDGYLAGCVNHGAIHGRKDVGGIVGQAEPWLVLDPGPQTLDRLRSELDTLDRLINRALSSAENTGDRISAHLTAMGGFTGDARDSSKRLLDRAMSFADDNVAEINVLAADVANALDKISPAMDDLSDAGRRLEQLSRQLDRAFEDMEEAADSSGTVFAALRASARDLRQGRDELSAAMQEFQAALDAIRRAVFPGGSPSFPPLEELAESRERIRRAFDNMRNAGNRLDAALSDLQQALGEAGLMSNQLGNALEDLQDAANSSASIGRLLKSAFQAISSGVDQLTSSGPARFISLGEEAREAGDSLYSALNGLSGEMETLNRTVQSGANTLTGDLRAISRQFNIICSVMMDAIENLGERRQEGIEGFVQDTSDEDIADTREGKAADCRNTGTVEGDRNVGGIAGAVAVELDLDPEDDSASRLTFEHTYETKAILQGCVNQGAVTAKKDCAGGLAGRMDLGTVLDCQNYGPVSSTGGNYVGGAAGWAAATVRNCFVKSTLSGKDYIGGIAGWASRLRDCCAIATVTEGTECLGAIAGGVETGGVLQNNLFLNTGLAGVDGVSYAGRAEPVSFDRLSRLPGAPPEFTSFTLTLLAEGETVAQIPFLYGEDLSRVPLPPVPEKEDCYGQWPDFDASGVQSDITVEAVYAPWVTVTASQELSGNRSLALAEGKFTQEAVLHVSDGGQAPPQEAGEAAAVWEIALSGTELGPEDSVPLRLLSPDGGEANVWQYRNGAWQPAEAVLNGQYLLLTMKGTRGVFCIQPQAGTKWMVPAAAGAGVLALLLLIARRRRLNQQAAASVQAQKHAESASAK